MRSKVFFLVLSLLLVLVWIPATSHAQTGCNGTLYTVRTGDTLYSIALSFGVDVNTVANANGIFNINDVKIAQTLCIPGVGNTGNQNTGTGGPTGAVGSTTGCAGVTYVVGAGENLYRIGLQYNLTPQQVAAANGIANVNSVFSGQVLCIPTGGTFGTGGPVAQSGAGAGTGTAASSTLPATVPINGGSYIVERAIDARVTAYPQGTVDGNSGYATTASITLDATNNLLRVQSGGHIPNSQVGVFVSSAPGDLSGGIIGAVFADANGRVDGYVEIPFLNSATRQYVMLRSYDGRLTFGFFDLGSRFP